MLIRLNKHKNNVSKVSCLIFSGCCIRRSNTEVVQGRSFSQRKNAFFRPDEKFRRVAAKC